MPPQLPSQDGTLYLGYFLIKWLRGCLCAFTDNINTELLTGKKSPIRNDT